MHASSQGLSESERAFYQRRVAAFGAVTASSFAFFALFRAVTALTYQSPAALTHPSLIYHVLASLCFFIAWVGCRGQRRSPRTIRVFETVALVTAVVATVLMGIHIPIAARPDFILLLALTYAMLARSIWVPSTARRSALLNTIVGVTLVVSQYFTFSTPAAVEFATASNAWGDGPTAQRLGVFQAVRVGAWWVLTAFIATATSKVIYGLRRDVRDAKRLGQYQLEGKLGEGGMGVVYRARHALLQRPTAVKLLRPGQARVENLKRFEKEVQLTARLNHPNIITIFDYGHTADGVFYYAMEYIDGVTLDTAVKGCGAMSVGRTLYILKCISGALVEAHGVGLIHRDIKPANVLLYLPHNFGGVVDGVKLLDFGLVKELQQSGGIALTNTNTISGTPQYMAPEAIRDPSSVDVRSDLYAVGAVGYYLLTAHHVFDGGNIVEVCGHHLHTQPTPPSVRSGRNIPADLERLILRCLAKDPRERPQSARELEQLIDLCQTHDHWTAGRSEQWWQAWRANHRVPEPGTGQVSGDPILTIDVNRDADSS